MIFSFPSSRFDLKVNISFSNHRLATPPARKRTKWAQLKVTPFKMARL
jgi:hypothetical protein